MRHTLQICHLDSWNAPEHSGAAAGHHVGDLIKPESPQAAVLRDPLQLRLIRGKRNVAHVGLRPPTIFKKLVSFAHDHHGKGGLREHEILKQFYFKRAGRPRSTPARVHTVQCAQGVLNQPLFRINQIKKQE